MTIKVGINGCGRIGRLFLRAAWQWPEFDFIQLNDPAGDAHTTTHLLQFDSVHGTWSADINGPLGVVGAVVFFFVIRYP